MRPPLASTTTAGDGTGQREDVAQLRHVCVEGVGGEAGRVVDQVRVVGEDVARRVLAGRALLLALAFHSEPQFDRGAEGEFDVVVSGDDLVGTDERLHGETPDGRDWKGPGRGQAVVRRNPARQVRKREGVRRGRGRRGCAR